MQNTIEIAHLSRAEKLRVMEAIWDDLTNEAESLESPDWHNHALQETEHRLTAGQEQIVDWQEAKTVLRKRFE
ncbi:MAG: addiction module protein [Chlorobiaceae bacterium]